MSFFNRFFFKGLIVVVPVTLTIYLLMVIAVKAENLFGPMLKKALGPGLYVPGFGIFLTVCAIFFVGVLVSNFITGSIIKFFISQFEKIPFIKAIYGPLRDLMSLFGGAGPSNMKKVVIVELESMGIEAIGLVTREEFDDLPANTFGEGKIAVYIPMSYMLGGFTSIVDREKVRPLDIPVEKAIKLAITGWIKADKSGI